MEIVKYILYAVGIVLAIASYIVAYVKAKKSNDMQKLQVLEEYLYDLVISAEKTFGSGTGEIKLDNVLTKATLYSLQNNIKISQEALKNKINKIVDTTNNVNVGKTQSTTPICESGANN